MEHYTLSLLGLSVASIIYYFILAASASAGIWGVIIYCCVVAVWSTLYAESWKRYNAVLAYTWDVQDFEEEEQPRPEFLRAYHEGRYRATEFGGLGAMSKIKGFYGSDGSFVSHPEASDQVTFSMKVRYWVYWSRTIPALAIAVFTTCFGSLSLLTVRMIWSISVNVAEDSPFLSQSGAQICSLLNVVWILVMNTYYRKLAAWLNDLENFRTETEYNDALIFKTFFFQFFNSFLSCFYVAFIKGGNVSLFGAYGATDEVTGKPFADTCGKRPTGVTGYEDQPWLQADPSCPSPQMLVATGEDLPGLQNGAEPLGCNMLLDSSDCMGDLRILMTNFLGIKYVISLSQELLLPIVLGGYFLADTEIG